MKYFAVLYITLCLIALLSVATAAEDEITTENTTIIENTTQPTTTTPERTTELIITTEPETTINETTTSQDLAVETNYRLESIQAMLFIGLMLAILVFIIWCFMQIFDRFIY